MGIDDDPRSSATAHAIHEINNALAGIQYSFLLIKDAIPAEHPNQSSVAAIERGIARIATITQQLHAAYLFQKGA
jgi:signal transduction histidine kinase